MDFAVEAANRPETGGYHWPQHLREYHCLQDFRPLLIILWPYLDFSDAVLQGGFKRDVQYQKPRALIGFFRRRGIVTLDGISIFRVEDFVHCQDTDCNDLFQPFCFVESLSSICAYTTIEGSRGLKWLLDTSDPFDILLRVFARNPAASKSNNIRRIASMQDAESLERKIEKKEQIDLRSFDFSLDAYVRVIGFLCQEQNISTVKSVRMNLQLDTMIHSKVA